MLFAVCLVAAFGLFGACLLFVWFLFAVCLLGLGVVGRRPAPVRCSPFVALRSLPPVRGPPFVAPRSLPSVRCPPFVAHRLWPPVRGPPFVSPRSLPSRCIILIIPLLIVFNIVLSPCHRRRSSCPLVVQPRSSSASSASFSVHVLFSQVLGCPGYPLHSFILIILYPHPLPSTLLPLPSLASNAIVAQGFFSRRILPHQQRRSSPGSS